MQPVDDDTMLLFHYGELPAREADAIRARMQDDAALADRYAQLAAVLDAVPEPEGERDEFYGRRVWAGIESKLDIAVQMQRQRPDVTWRWAGLAAAFGLVAVIAFQLGKSEAPEQAMVAEQAPTRVSSARAMQASFQNHMESATRLFQEIENSSSVGVMDVEAEKNWAQTLLVANRLYRFAAEQAGQSRVAQVLADMEPLLIELSNSDRTLTDEQFDLLRRRIEDADLVFKAMATQETLKKGAI